MALLLNCPTKLGHCFGNDSGGGDHLAQTPPVRANNEHCGQRVHNGRPTLHERHGQPLGAGNAHGVVDKHKAGWQQVEEEGNCRLDDQNKPNLAANLATLCLLLMLQLEQFARLQPNCEAGHEDGGVGEQAADHDGSSDQQQKQRILKN